MKQETRMEFDETIQNELYAYNSLSDDNPLKEQTLKRLVTLNNIVNETDQVEQEWYDKQEKRRIDEEKNKSTNEVEQKKVKHGYVKMIFEGIVLIGITVYEWTRSTRNLEAVTKFEENNRYTTQAFRLWQGKKPKSRK